MGYHLHSPDLAALCISFAGGDLDMPLRQVIERLEAMDRLGWPRDAWLRFLHSKPRCGADEMGIGCFG